MRAFSGLWNVRHWLGLRQYAPMGHAGSFTGIGFARCFAGIHRICSIWFTSRFSCGSPPSAWSSTGSAIPSTERWRGCAKIERPRYGYYLDNSIDCIAQLLLAIGHRIVGLCAVRSVSARPGGLPDGFGVELHPGQCFRRFPDQLCRRRSDRGPRRFMVLNALLIIFPPASCIGRLPLTYPNLWSLAWSSAILVTFLVSMVKQVRAARHRGTGTPACGWNRNRRLDAAAGSGFSRGDRPWLIPENCLPRGLGPFISRTAVWLPDDIQGI